MEYSIFECFFKVIAIAGIIILAWLVLYTYLVSKEREITKEILGQILTPEQLDNLKTRNVDIEGRLQIFYQPNKGSCGGRYIIKFTPKK